MKVPFFVMLLVVVFTSGACTLQPAQEHLEQLPEVQAEGMRIPITEWEDLKTPEFAPVAPVPPQKIPPYVFWISPTAKIEVWTGEMLGGEHWIEIHISEDFNKEKR